MRDSLGRPVTISDVATAAGVSRAAVSKVLRDAYGVSPAMRERVNRAIEELDYRPNVAARALRGSSYRLGLEIPAIGAGFMTQIVDGAKQVMEGTPYQLMLAVADGPGYGAIDALADGAVDGIIAVSPLVDPDWLEKLSQRTPVVMLGRHDDAQNNDVVAGDDEAGTRLAMAHLTDLGHHRIAHVTETEAVTRPGSGTPHAIRLQTYLQCMNEAGFDDFAKITRRRPKGDGIREAAAELLDADDPPTAIFAGHDDIALDVLAELADRGRQDISVIGYDNTHVGAHPMIRLSSIDQGGPEMGAQAVTMLLERIQGRSHQRHHVTTPSLRIRATTTPSHEA